MRSSIEVRAPLLNKKLELTAKISFDIKMKQHPKYILKQVLKSYLPNDIINLPKFGFVYQIQDT